ncbi:lysophosphatidic acid phosphatase type 6-like isoform X2 [Pomacea canaliculata]|uniref:lysophosphatidic acid phosphatase type 6-like isoform X2 n=1 Tax=Pomacea canaliculata TaxID=400727 RepID=UPI000D72D15E|nr:lysophosphatidic acid phosphatase type 6-like isoform X2 [Pomacea canaliculata]
MNLKRTLQICRNLSLLLGGAFVVHHQTRRPENALCPPAIVPEKKPDRSVAIVIRNGDIPLTLQQVHVFFRHGARLPLHLSPGLDEVSYPEDKVLKDAPHTMFRHRIVMLPDRTPRTLSEKEESYKLLQLKGGGYAGNLTVLGQDQAYILGRSLRDMYIFRHRFLSEDYSAQDISVQSTNINRTIVSARCVLAGMFGKERLNETGGVEITVCELKDDFLLPNDMSCNVLAETIKFATSDMDNIGLMEDRLIIEKALGINSEATGVKINFDHLRDDLTSRITHGYNMPTKLLPYVDMIENNAIKTIYYATCGMIEEQRPALTCLVIGRALNRVVDAMGSLIYGEKAVKMYLWSTHDTTMVALLEALGIFNWRWPPFVADLRLELYKSGDDRHWVRVLYCSQEMNMRDSSTPIMPFEDFEKALKPYLLDDSEFESLSKMTLDQMLNAYNELKPIEVQDSSEGIEPTDGELEPSEAIIEPSDDTGEPSDDTEATVDEEDDEDDEDE